MWAIDATNPEVWQGDATCNGSRSDSNPVHETGDQQVCIQIGRGFKMRAGLSGDRFERATGRNIEHRARGDDFIEGVVGLNAAFLENPSKLTVESIETSLTTQPFRL